MFLFNNLWGAELEWLGNCRGFGDRDRDIEIFGMENRTETTPGQTHTDRPFLRRAAGVGATSILAYGLTLFVPLNSVQSCSDTAMSLRFQELFPVIDTLRYPPVGTRMSTQHRFIPPVVQRHRAETCV